MYNNKILSYKTKGYKQQFTPPEGFSKPHLRGLYRQGKPFDGINGIARGLCLRKGFDRIRAVKGRRVVEDG